MGETSKYSLNGVVPWLMIVATVVGNAAAQMASAAENDEALALLRGVENVRKKVTSGQLTISIHNQHPDVPKWGADEINAEVDFYGIKRRYTATTRKMEVLKKDLNERETLVQKFEAMGDDRDAFVKQGFAGWKQVTGRVIYNGDVFAFKNSEELAARIKDIRDGSEWFAFDPRTLGISEDVSFDETIEEALPYRQAKLVTLVDEKDDSRKRQLRHVRLVSPKDSVSDYWIGHGFTVVKRELSQNINPSIRRRRLVTAEYNEECGNAIPWKSTYETYINERLRTRVIITCTDVTLNIPTDQNMFELTALNIPRGTMVIDGRSRRVSYWDGNQLVDKFPGTSEMPRKVNEKRKSRRWSIIIGMLSVIGLISVLILRRRFHKTASVSGIDDHDQSNE